MHLIEQPYDIILSIFGPEWHNLATVKEVIDEETMEKAGLFFNITKSQVVNWTGENDMQEAISALAELDKTSPEFATQFSAFMQSMVFVDSHKTVMADLSCRADLIESGHPTSLPLAIPKKSYEIISHRQLFDTVKRVFDAPKIVTAGTLKACKVFFMSLDIGESVKYGPRKDEFRQYLDIITSHDGTLGARFYDSGTRIVCMNTLLASIGDSGELDMRVFHSSGAQAALNNVSIQLDEILSGRAAYFDSLGYLDTLPCDLMTAQYLTAAFFNSKQMDGDGNLPDILSTQMFNRCEEIGHLFKKGQGNLGETMYDLFNGMTEYYTWGSGTGKKTTKQEKFLMSRDATATPNEDKNAFYNFLLSGDFAEPLTRGEKLFKEALNKKG